MNLVNFMMFLNCHHAKTPRLVFFICFVFHFRAGFYELLNVVKQLIDMDPNLVLCQFKYFFKANKKLSFFAVIFQDSQGSTYQMYHVPLVPRDAGREETIFRIDQSLKTLMKVSDDVFNRVENRITRIHQKAERIDKRTELLEKKLEYLQESDNVVTFVLPRQLPKIPPTEESPSTSLFRINVDSEYLANSDELPVFRRADDHILRPCEPIDFTFELKKADTFFLTSHVMREYEQSEWERYKKRLMSSLRELPLCRDDMDIAELFYAGTSIPAYSGVTGDFPQHHLDADDGTSTRRSGRNEEAIQSRLHEQLLEDTALSSRLMEDDNADDDHPLAFRIEHSSNDKKPIVEMPGSLPNLKGHAQDFTLHDLGIDENLLPDLNDDSSITVVADIQIREPPPQEIPTADIIPRPASPPAALVVELPSVAPIIVIPAVVLPPAPTAPPPPPPPLPPPLPSTMSQTPDAFTQSTASSVTFSPTKSIDGRTDLMAAIRAAGGASNAKLSKITDKQTKRKGRFDGILESSALGSTEKTVTPGSSRSAPPAGGDLMSALSKALDARRKAISGNDRSSTSSANPTSSSVPAPPHFSDEDWD